MLTRVVTFQHKGEAERFLETIKERFKAFGLELEPDKTRLMEFGKYARENRKKRGQGKPETFDFLGFTHYCSKSQKGYFRVKRKTSRKKMRMRLTEMNDWSKKQQASASQYNDRSNKCKTARPLPILRYYGQQYEH